jgi:arylsulfatase A
MDTLSRRAFLGTAAAVSAALTFGLRHAAAASDGRPNLVFLLCDDLGYGDLGCYGHATIKTPRLDALAREGVRMTACYAAAPVCSPARAGAITGRNPYRCGIADWIPDGSPVHLRRGETTLPALLGAAGYRTAFCGKWHLSGTLDGTQPTPGDHGFDYWFATQNNAVPNHRNPINFSRNGTPAGPIEGDSSEIIVKDAIQWLEQKKDGPFALFIWFHSPHEPIATAPSFRDRYMDAFPEEANYFGNVSQMDHATGLLLDALDSRGLREKTLVWFTSDNGPETLRRYKGAENSHGTPGSLRGMKLHLYEGGIRVPGICRWPGHLAEGSELAIPVSGVDLLPTFCALAEAPIPAGTELDGTDVRSVFDGIAPERARPLYWRYDDALGIPKHALRAGPWKILAAQALDQWELYNLETDPGETLNLATEEPGELARMQSLLREAAAEVDWDFKQHAFA